LVKIDLNEYKKARMQLAKDLAKMIEDFGEEHGMIPEIEFSHNINQEGVVDLISARVGGDRLFDTK
jgi:hypothetical protein